MRLPSGVPNRDAVPDDARAGLVADPCGVEHVGTIGTRIMLATTATALWIDHVRKAEPGGDISVAQNSTDESQA